MSPAKETLLRHEERQPVHVKKYEGRGTRRAGPGLEFRVTLGAEKSDTAITIKVASVTMPAPRSCLLRERAELLIQAPFLLSPWKVCTSPCSLSGVCKV